MWKLDLHCIQKGKCGNLKEEFADWDRLALLVWSTTVNIVLGHIVVWDSEMVIVRLIENVKRCDLIGLCYQS